MNNLTENQIIEKALENLGKTTLIKGHWNDIENKEIDGVTTLQINGANLVLNTEIKKELTLNHVDRIEEMAKEFPQLLMVGYRIIPKVKAELRKRNIAYLEGNGNIYLKDQGVFLFIDTQETFPKAREKPERAFTKTGLKVIFHFLIDEGLMNKPYREIAEITGVALGVVHNVVRGLRKMDYLIKTDKAKFKFNNKNELLNKWMAAYNVTLKPTLLIGRFRFLKDGDFVNWKKVKLTKEKTFWGGDPAGDLLTNYLKPAELTLYTTETRNEVIKNYRLVPDESGMFFIYQKFWHVDKTDKSTVPPLLIYADLKNTDDMRCLETAQIIYEQYLQNQF